MSATGFEEQGLTKDELLLFVKALAWKCDDRDSDTHTRVFLTERDIYNAKHRLEVVVFKTQDPWGVEVEVIDYDNTVDEKLKSTFGAEIPSPETLKRAYKRVYGVDL